MPNVARPVRTEAVELEIAAQSSALLLKQRARLRRVLTREDLMHVCDGALSVAANYVIQRCASCLIFVDA